MDFKWTAERIGELRRLVATPGMTLATIGERFGVSRCAIAGAKHRHLDDGRAANPGFKRNGKHWAGDAKRMHHGKIWTDERLDELRGYIKAGLKARQIADKFGKRLADIVRAAHKIGIELETLPHEMPSRPKQPAAKRVPSTPTPLAPAETVSPLSVFARFDHGYQGQQGRLKILQLTADDCRFPITMPTGELRYCGDRIARDSYCQAHYDRCYTPAVRRNKWAR